jgi:formate-dependent phosphoribosylglycinamide formyltransferase (GAR transformylase)
MSGSTGAPNTRDRLSTPATSHVIIADNEDYTPRFIDIEEDLATQEFRHFGKPSTYGDRRTDAVLAVGRRDQREQDRNV